MAMLGVWKSRPIRTVVICPRAVMRSAWEKDAAILGVPLAVCYSANKRERERLILSGGDANGVYVTNFDTFRTSWDTFIRAGCRRLIVDESSRVKNREAKLSIACHGAADKMEEVYLLSGTPAPNCPTELWSQLRTLSPNAAGRNFWKWAFEWFDPRREWVRGKQVITGWSMKKGAEEKFSDSVKTWAWYLDKRECIDLPDQIDSVYDVELDAGEANAYRSARDELLIIEPTGTVAGIKKLGGPTRIKAEALLTKLRQITGGMVLVNGSPVVVGHSKLDALADILGEIGPREKCLVWAEYRHEIDAIQKRCIDIGRSPSILDGRTSGDVASIIEAFADGSTDTIIAHPQAAGHGVDGLQRVCRYAVYYSMAFSAEQHEQSRDRLHRSGQSEKVTYYYLLGALPKELQRAGERGSVDHAAYRTCKNKAKRQGVLLDTLASP